jgi:hypothetical protein
MANLISRIIPTGVFVYFKTNARSVYLDVTDFGAEEMD